MHTVFLLFTLLLSLLTIVVLVNQPSIVGRYLILGPPLALEGHFIVPDQVHKQRVANSRQTSLLGIHRLLADHLNEGKVIIVEIADFDFGEFIL